MSSLISPGPGTPMQGVFQNSWLANSQSWHDNGQRGFGPNMQDQSQASNQMRFHLNSDEEYVPYEPPGGQGDESHIIHTGQVGFKTSPGGALSLPFSAIQPSVANENASAKQSVGADDAAAENAKRLRELRAKLMAKKPKGSREASPALKPKNSPRKAQPNSPKSSIDPDSGSNIQSSKPNGTFVTSKKPTGPGQTKMPVRAGSGSGMISDLDNLFAEVRNETKAVEQAAPRSEKKANGTETGENMVPKFSTTKGNAMVDQHHANANRISSSDLSDGEIRSSDEEQAPPAKSDVVSKTLAKSKETSLDIEEKSRRESEVEATYQPPASNSRDSQEKLRRQSQVDMTYSPLKRSSGSIPKPPNPQIDTTPTSRKSSGHVLKSPKSAIEQPSRPWISQTKGRAGDYDSYVPPYRKSSLQERPSGVEPPPNVPKRNPTSDRADADDRRRAIEQNERAAAEYKRALEARPQPSRVISHTDTTYLGRTTNDKQETTNAINSKQVASPLVSPTQATNSADSDLKDWLELTEYYDEEYRNNRLSRHRKKKELDQIRYQLEQEEQLELEQRSRLRTNALPNDSTSQKVAQMAPPTIPLRESNGTNVSMKATAPAAAQFDIQVATSTLKRQHAEDDTDARNKVARVENVQTNFPPPSSSTIKDESSPVFPGSLPLEHRISRDDNQMTSTRYRPRSRSPERYRRRSASPERRRFSVPDHNFMPTCHNCGQPGHYQNTCVEPRRDGRERYRNPSTSQRGYQRFNDVSPNYLGKNPQKGFRDPRDPRAGGRNTDGDEKRP